MIHKTKKLATFFSFLGYIGIVLGVYSFFEDRVGIGVRIICLAIGVALKLLAGFVSKKKSGKETKKNQDE